MAYLANINRFQNSMGSLEEVIKKDTTVCFVDAFVEYLDLCQKLETKLQESYLARKNNTLFKPLWQPTFFKLSKVSLK